ncbi:MAG: helix-turn-helix transcriptional regulator [Bacteroidales bacterium]|nr:helix-turn-helix transcriptional regulator [Bacteroidales bacterium]
MNQPISVSEVVAQVPLSRRLLETRFKNATGSSIYKYILNAKIERLCRLLSEGWNVSQAAYELGFYDVKNLSRVFRRIKGISPSEYRRAAQSEE